MTMTSVSRGSTSPRSPSVCRQRSASSPVHPRSRLVPSRTPVVYLTRPWPAMRTTPPLHGDCDDEMERATVTTRSAGGQPCSRRSAAIAQGHTAIKQHHAARVVQHNEGPRIQRAGGRLDVGPGPGEAGPVENGCEPRHLASSILGRPNRDPTIDARQQQRLPVRVHPGGAKADGRGNKAVPSGAGANVPGHATELRDKLLHGVKRTVEGVPRTIHAVHRLMLDAVMGEERWFGTDEARGEEKSRTDAPRLRSHPGSRSASRSCR